MNCSLVFVLCVSIQIKLVKKHEKEVLITYLMSIFTFVFWNVPTNRRNHSKNAQLLNRLIVNIANLLGMHILPNIFLTFYEKSFFFLALGETFVVKLIG